MISSSFKKKGFALIYAVLVSSLFLAVGATIVSATLKNFLFSSSGRESQFAFYSADTGVECALYWDKVQGRFPTSTVDALTVDPNGITCNNETVSVANNTMTISTTPESSDVKFSLSDPANGKICVSVELQKNFNAVNNSIETAIISRGYNTCDTLNQRRLERGLRVDY